MAKRTTGTMAPKAAKAPTAAPTAPTAAPTAPTAPTATEAAPTAPTATEADKALATHVAAVAYLLSVGFVKLYGTQQGRGYYSFGGTAPLAPCVYVNNEKGTGTFKLYSQSQVGKTGDNRGAGNSTDCKVLLTMAGLKATVSALLTEGYTAGTVALWANAVAPADKGPKVAKVPTEVIARWQAKA